MNPIPLILSSCVVASAVSVAVVQLTGPAAPPEHRQSQQPAAPVVQDSLNERLDALERSVLSLAERVEAASASERRVAPRIDDAAVARAVQDWLERNATGGELEERVAAATAGKKTFDFDAALAKLRSRELSWDDETALWQNASEDEQKRLVAALEKIAEQNPYDAGAQVDLGKAYIQRLFKADFVQKGILATKADQVFDKALEINERHWDARFNKAMSLSNWPAFLGKRPEAIANFEALIQQQQSGTPDPKHAAAYLYLGNLHAQQGDMEEAMEVWRKGLARHPQSEALKGKVR